MQTSVPQIKLDQQSISLDCSKVINEKFGIAMSDALIYDNSLVCRAMEVVKSRKLKHKSTETLLSV